MTTGKQEKKEARLPAELRLFSQVTGLVTLGIWLVAALVRHQRWPYPFTWPLAEPGTSLFDLTIYFTRFSLLHHAAFFAEAGFPFMYFAPGVPLYRLFYLFGHRGAAVAYLLLAGVLVVLGAVLLQQAMVRRGMRSGAATLFLGAAVLTSYPLVFALERGNLEVLLACGVAAGVAAYWRGYRLTAAIVWGVFGAVKLYPLLLLALFLSRQQIRYLLAGLATAATTMWLSLWYTGPTIRIAAAGLQRGSHRFISIYTVHFAAPSFDHALFATPKLLLQPFGVNLRHLLAGYMLVATVTMLALYVLRIRRLPAANQIVVLLVSCVLLPPTSFDYTLVQLYAAWAILVLIAVDLAREGRSLPFGRVWFLLFAALFTPANLLVFRGVSYQGVEKSLVLTGLLALAMLVPLDGCAPEQKELLFRRQQAPAEK